MSLKIIVCIFLLCVCLSTCLTIPRPRWSQLAAPTPLRDSRIPVVNWIEQKLDHYDPAEDRTWLQRYFVNEQYYTNGGPIFVMVGLEGTADPDWLRGGQMVELALFYKAKIFLLEQRYYGESHPTEDTSVENLRFFTSEQNLGDLSFLVQAIKISHPQSKVVVFGGSFAGNLAAWGRQKYPNLIDAAVVSSSPLLAKFDFYEYFEEVTKVLNDASEACVEDLRTATTDVEGIMFGPNGGDTIASMFTLCAPLDVENKMDVMNFFTAFANIYASVVQTARSLQDVQDYCDLMTNPIHGATPLDRFIELGRIFFHPTDQCFEIRYEPFLEIFQNTSWSGQATVVGRRQFLYQTCTELGDFEESSSSLQPFGDFFPLDVFVQICKDYYDESFDAEFIAASVENTNLLYGGLSPEVTNIVFVHGSLDPWRLLGVVEDLSETATAIVIEESSHIADMRSSSSADSPQLTEARNQIKDLVGTWV